MENLILSINVISPLFLTILLGYTLRSLHMLDEHVLTKMNNLCFKVFLPIYLFNCIYTTDMAMAFNPRLISFCACCVLGLFLLLMLIIPRLEKENPRRGVMVQGMFRSNFVLFGLPVATSLCGEELLGPTSMLICIIVPMFNVLSVIALEWFRGGTPNLKKMTIGVLKNPMIIASAIGAGLNLLRIPLPSAVEKTLFDLGRTATPLALVMLGGEFMFSRLRTVSRQLVISTVGKLIISPLLMVSLAISFGFRNECLIPILLMFGAPTAVSSFTMAQLMDGDGQLAASLVVFTAAFSIFTLFVWIFLLKQYGMI